MLIHVVQSKDCYYIKNKVNKISPLGRTIFAMGPAK